MGMNFTTNKVYTDAEGRAWHFRQDYTMRDWEELQKEYSEEEATIPLIVERFRVVRHLTERVFDGEEMYSARDIPWDSVPTRIITEIYDMIDTGDLPLSQQARMQAIADGLLQTNSTGKQASPQLTTPE